MSAAVGDTFINYALLDAVRKAYGARVFDEYGDESEAEDRHISELERRLSAFDDKEAFIAVRTLVKYHKDTVKKTIQYIKEEGSANE